MLPIASEEVAAVPAFSTEVVSGSENEALEQEAMHANIDIPAFLRRGGL
jgi:hypothetical protein